MHDTYRRFLRNAWLAISVLLMAVSFALSFTLVFVAGLGTLLLAYLAHSADDRLNMTGFRTCAVACGLFVGLLSLAPVLTHSTHDPEIWLFFLLAPIGVFGFVSAFAPAKR